MEKYNVSLAKCIEQAITTAGTLAADYNRIYRMDGYTDEYKADKRAQMERSLSATVAELKEQGLAIIDKIIEETNTAERKEAERRAKDTDYNRRLHDKIKTIRGLADKPEVSPEEINALQISLSEFENDTLSIALIEGAVAGIPGAARFRTTIPANHNGEHQANMEELKKYFSRALSEAEESVKGRTSIDTSDNMEYALDLANAFKAYCVYQSPNMSSDPAVAWAAVLQEYPEMAAATKHWMMRFRIADKIPQAE